MNVVEGVLLGIALSALMFFIAILISPELTISKETGRDICKNLNPNSTIVDVYAEKHKLVCVTPSFDSTSNIIFRESGEQ